MRATMKNLYALIVTTLFLLAPSVVMAQGLANTDFNMLVPNSPPSTGGSFPPAGCGTANGVLINNAAPCSAQLTYNPATGAMVMDATVALAGTTAFTINPASASGLLLDAQVGGVSKFSINSSLPTVLFPSNGGPTPSLSFTSANNGFYTNTGNQLVWRAAAGNTHNASFSYDASTTRSYIAADAIQIDYTVGDIVLWRDTTGVLAQTDPFAAVPQSYRIYHDWSSSGAIFSRMELGFNAHSGIAAIDVAAATSTLPNFGIYVGGSIKLDYGNDNNLGWTISGSAGRIAAFLTGAGGGDVRIGAGIQLGFSSTGDTRNSLDTILTRAAAANIQFGAANVNGAPVAQTLSFQGALAGSATNQASANTTIIGSLGTGTGTNGDIIFQTGVKTSTGTAQATATTALTIKGETGRIAIANRGSAVAPILTFGGDTQTGIYSATTDNIDVSNSGTVYWGWTASGNLQAASGTFASGNGGLQFAVNAASGKRPMLMDVGDDVLGIYSSTATNPTSIEVYNTSSSSNANREYAVFGFDNAAGGASSACPSNVTNTLCIGTWNAGSGVARPIEIVTGGTLAVTISTAQLVTFAKNIATNGSIDNFGSGTMAVDQNNNRVNLFNSTSLGWASNVPNAPNTTICRSADGVAEIGTTACNALGGLLLATITASSTVTFSGLTTGTNADFLCLSAGGVVLIQTSACTISTLRFKPDWTRYTESAMSVVRQLEIGTFHLDGSLASQADPNAHSLQIGLNAENIARVLPMAAVYENDMLTPKSYRQEGVIALYGKALQEIGAGNDNRDTRIAKLEAANQNLRTELEALKRSIAR